MDSFFPVACCRAGREYEDSAAVIGPLRYVVVAGPSVRRRSESAIFANSRKHVVFIDIGDWYIYDTAKDV